MLSTLELENCVLNHSTGRLADNPDVTLRVPHGVLGAVLGGEADLKSKVASGEIEIEGERDKLGELFSVLDLSRPWFNIVTP